MVFRPMTRRSRKQMRSDVTNWAPSASDRNGTRAPSRYCRRSAHQSFSMASPAMLPARVSPLADNSLRLSALLSTRRRRAVRLPSGLRVLISQLLFCLSPRLSAPGVLKDVQALQLQVVFRQCHGHVGPGSGPRGPLLVARVTVLIPCRGLVPRPRNPRFPPRPAPIRPGKSPGFSRLGSPGRLGPGSGT
jgi:hypothetical protein